MRGPHEAVSCHRQALDLARQIGVSWDQAQALAGLGRVRSGHRSFRPIEDWLRLTLEIFRQIGAAQAANVSAELEALACARPNTGGNGQAADERTATAMGGW
jgi:hypothetical protein